jgi:hypothetical protein
VRKPIAVLAGTWIIHGLSTADRLSAPAEARLSVAITLLRSGPPAGGFTNPVTVAPSCTAVAGRDYRPAGGPSVGIDDNSVVGFASPANPVSFPTQIG